MESTQLSKTEVRGKKNVTSGLQCGFRATFKAGASLDKRKVIYLVKTLLSVGSVLRGMGETERDLGGTGCQ